MYYLFFCYIFVQQLETTVFLLPRPTLRGEFREDNMTATFFVFNGHGNYSETFCWDNGISMNVENPTQHTLSEVELFEDLNKIPNVGECIEWFGNSYGGSRNATIIVASDSLEKAVQLALDYQDTYPVVEYEDERIEFVVAQDPNGVLTIFESNYSNPISLMGSRWSYVCTCSSQEEADEYINEKVND